MHHGQTRGKLKTHKVCKTPVNFTKSEEICKSSGEIGELGENVLKQHKNRGKIAGND